MFEFKKENLHASRVKVKCHKQNLHIVQYEAIRWNMCNVNIPKMNKMDQLRLAAIKWMVIRASLYASTFLPLFNCQEIVALQSFTLLNCIGWFHFYDSNMVARKKWGYFLDFSIFTCKKNKKHKVCLTNARIILMLNHACDWWNLQRLKFI